MSLPVCLITSPIVPQPSCQVWWWLGQSFPSFSHFLFGEVTSCFVMSLPLLLPSPLMSLNLPAKFGGDWVSRFPVLAPLPVWWGHFLFDDVTSGWLYPTHCCSFTLLSSLVEIGQAVWIWGHKLCPERPFWAYDVTSGWGIKTGVS